MKRLGCEFLVLDLEYAFCFKEEPLCVIHEF